MLLRKLVSHGQAIMCTIHQPSAVLLSLFDQILILEQPGKTIYFGPLSSNSETMIRYFEGRGARPCREGENPADWVLEVTRRGEANWGELWDTSPEKVALVTELGNIMATQSRASDDNHAASFSSQLWQVLSRMTKDHWRTPTYLWSMFFLCFGTVSLSHLPLTLTNSPNLQ